MLGNSTYFLIIMAPGLAFNLVVWAVWWRILMPRARAIAATILVISAYWGLLDLVAVKLLGIWSFRLDHTTGLIILGLPVEEWVLFLMSGGFIVPLIYVFADRRRGRTV